MESSVITSWERHSVMLSELWHQFSHSSFLFGELLVNRDPFMSNCVLCVILSLLSFALGELTNNYSQVDRLWSIVPVVYAFNYSIRAMWRGDIQWDGRLIVMFILVVAWGIRLTFNFARKGGYSLSNEDYRWNYVRSWTWLRKRLVRTCFNLIFISIYQHILLLAIVLPFDMAYRSVSVPFNAIDHIASGLFVCFLVLEYVADSQQWQFQSTKANPERKNVKHANVLGTDLSYGFLTHGLFHYARHPNCFAEMAIWWTVYLYSVASTKMFFNWSILGALMISSLISVSTMITEHISNSKYPQYQRYIQETSMFIPWPSKQAKKKS